MRLFFVSAFVVIVDQVTKLLVKGLPALNLSGVPAGQKIPLLGDILSITLVENPGIAFGINFGPQFKLAISIFTLIASIGLCIFLIKIRHKSFGLRFSIALILGGAVGNLIDRLFYGLIYNYAPLFHGKVVDFLSIRLFNIYLFNNILGSYIINAADLSVTVGMISLLFIIRKQHKTEEAGGPAAGDLLIKGKE